MKKSPLLLIVTLILTLGIDLSVSAQEKVSIVASVPLTVNPVTISKDKAVAVSEDYTKETLDYETVSFAFQPNENIVPADAKGSTVEPKIKNILDDEGKRGFQFVSYLMYPSNLTTGTKVIMIFVKKQAK